MENIAYRIEVFSGDTNPRRLTCLWSASATLRRSYTFAMLASTMFAFFALTSSVRAFTIVARNTSASSFVPLSPVGDVAAVQFGTGTPQAQTRIYYQHNNGNLIQHTVSPGPFTTSRTDNQNVIVNAQGVLWNTPIAVSAMENGGQGIHIYYLDKNRVLSEKRFTSADGWRPTASKRCPGCIQSAGFTVAEGSDALYAVQHSTNANVLRVGFVSTGAPGTLTEAVTTDFGVTWVLAPLPDA